MKASATSPVEAPKGSAWVPGAEPLAICMSCNSTFPPHFAECTNCQVALSVVRKCPTCGKVQSAHHVTCIYCADSFLREDGLSPAESGPLTRRRERAERRLRIMVGGTLALIIVAGLALVVHRMLEEETNEVIGQTYPLAPVSLRTKAAADAPPVKDVNPSDIMAIVGTTHDIMGNRWFRVVSGGIRGYVAAQDVAPPRSTDPEKGYEILRHSLMSLDNPEVLTEATQAVDLYHTSFPASIHYEELRWLLAERTRDFSEGARSPEMIGAARGIYEEIAGGNGEFAERARAALDELPTAVAPVERKRASPAPTDRKFSLVGGSTTESLGNHGKPTGPIRRVTVVSKTPLVVRLTQPAQISSGAVLYGEFARDVRVSQEVAVPQGSSAVVMVGQEGAGKKVASLILTGATVRGEPYRMAGYPLGMDIPGAGRLSPSRNMPASLPAGTSIEFRLQSDLVITQR